MGSPITIALTDDQDARLRAVAEKQIRNRKQQARLIFETGLAQWEQREAAFESELRLLSRLTAGEFLTPNDPAAKQGRVAKGSSRDQRPDRV